MNQLPVELRLKIFEIARDNAFRKRINRLSRQFSDVQSRWDVQRITQNRISVDRLTSKGFITFQIIVIVRDNQWYDIEYVYGRDPHVRIQWTNFIGGDSYLIDSFTPTSLATIPREIGLGLLFVAEYALYLIGEFICFVTRQYNGI